MEFFGAPRPATRLFVGPEGSEKDRSRFPKGHPESCRRVRHRPRDHNDARSPARAPPKHLSPRRHDSRPHPPRPPRRPRRRVRDRGELVRPAVPTLGVRIQRRRLPQHVLDLLERGMHAPHRRPGQVDRGLRRVVAHGDLGHARVRRHHDRLVLHGQLRHGHVGRRRRDVLRHLRQDLVAHDRRRRARRVGGGATGRTKSATSGSYAAPSRPRPRATRTPPAIGPEAAADPAPP